MASSALMASTEQNPASSTMSTARMRKIISSSTTRTFGTGGKSVDIDSLTLSPESRFRTGPRRSCPNSAGPLLRLSGGDSELNRAVGPADRRHDSVKGHGEDAGSSFK